MTYKNKNLSNSSFWDILFCVLKITGHDIGLGRYKGYRRCSDGLNVLIF